MNQVALESNGIGPSLTVNDLPRSIAFYTEAFGFTIIQRNEDEGVLRFVMLQAGRATLGLGQDDWAKGRNRQKGIGVRFWVQTDQDLNVLAARATRAGVRLDSEVGPLPWGPLAFSFTDPDGFLFTICGA